MSEISRLRWLCRRGMKELDVVMSRYLEQYYESASAEDQKQFKSLLEMPDPDLYGLLLGRSETIDPELARFTQFLRGISGQTNRES
ncbi:MAG: succinate dehydrogenase assembly factor 2 [Gammaproteobacteria bacterium]|nr:succinate dehydrogenase assembly factor 2 [Gammaproteobacteria bacterium]